MPTSEVVRVLIDTNGWISAVINTKFQKRIDDIIARNNVQILISEELFVEMRHAANKSYLQRYSARQKIDVYIQNLLDSAERIDICSIVTDCRDPSDNYLLALAKDGDADYLITGDNDLLILGQFGKTKIVTFNEFEKIVCPV